MKKKDYRKPSMRAVRISEPVMNAASLTQVDVNNSVTVSQKEDLGFGKKSIWDNNSEE